MDQDSAGGLGNIFFRDLFVHIANIMQIHIIQQINLFMQNKANFETEVRKQKIDDR